MKLIIVLLLPCFCYSQTCIIATRTKDSIFVGADTKAVGDSSSVPMCKIVKSGNRYLALSGFDFDLFSQIATKSFPHYSTLRDCAEYTKKVAPTYIKRYLLKIKKERPVFFENNKIDLSHIKVLIFGFEKDIAEVYAISFDIKFSDLIQIIPDLRYEMSDELRSQNQSVAIGHTEAVDPVLSNQKSNWWNNGYAIGQYNLIERQCKITPEYVSKPITVLILTKNKFDWYDPSKRNCF